MARPVSPHRITRADCPIGRLNLEWARLRVDLRAARRVQDWATTEPALARVTSLALIEEQAARSGGEESDALLLALLRLHRERDELAGRVLLQLMLPQAVRVSRCLQRYLERAEARATAVGLLWEVIATYPIARRPRRVAANITLDTLQAARSQRRRLAAHSQERLGLWDIEETAALLSALAVAQPSLTEEVRNLVAAATAEGVIRPEDAMLLIRVYATTAEGAEPQPRLVAEEMGISWVALRQRCSRAVRALSAAAAGSRLLSPA